MSYDPSTLQPRARERYLGFGRQYTAEQVLAQAHQTLLAYEKYGPLLLPYGFPTEDAQQLGDATDGLHACKVDHTQVSSTRQVLSTKHKSTRRRARDVRRCIRSALKRVLDTLLEQNQHDEAHVVDAALSKTSKLSGKDQQLLEQLDTLDDVLAEPFVVQAMAKRGGPDIVARLQTVRKDLNQCMRLRAGNPDRGAVADDRDILGGIIVSITRAAYSAASVAARELGQPAIATAFKLTHLRSRSSTAPAPELPESPEPEPPTTEPPITTEPVIK
jgi:hypothetical protein